MAHGKVSTLALYFTNKLKTKIAGLLIIFSLTGCASVACPKTVQLEAGTVVRHEVGESAVRNNTAIVRATWELRK